MLTRGGCRVSGDDMDIASALLDAIRDDPDDDLPRLAYADWLMEQPSQEDQARGEFIQLQCRLARMDADAPAIQETRRREAELLGEHRAAWLGELERVGGCELVRGFIRLTIAGKKWQRLAKASRLSEWSLVFGVRVTDVGTEELAGLAAWPALSDISELDMHGWGSGMPPTGFLHFMGVASWRLSCLRLGGGLLGEEGLRPLIETPLPSRLVRLAIEYESLYDIHIESLLAAHLPRLRDLSLKNNALLATGMASLTGISQLRRLCLAENRIRSYGVDVLARNEFSHLEDLDLSHNNIHDAGARSLLDAPFLPRLRRLRLEGNGILDEAVKQRFREILGARVEL